MKGRSPLPLLSSCTTLYRRRDKGEGYQLVSPPCPTPSPSTPCHQRLPLCPPPSLCLSSCPSLPLFSSPCPSHQHLSLCFTSTADAHFPSRVTLTLAPLPLPPPIHHLLSPPPPFLHPLNTPVPAVFTMAAEAHLPSGAGRLGQGAVRQGPNEVSGRH